MASHFRIALVAFVSSVLFVSVHLAHLPSNFHTCHKSDPNFFKCLTSSVDDAIKKLSSGNKKLGVIPLDPLQIAEIHVDQTPGSVSLDQTFRNVRIFGLSESKVVKFEADVDKGCRFYCEAVSPQIRNEMDFEIKGQFLIFPINGHGPGNVTIGNMRTKHNATCQRFSKNGEEYIRVTDYKLTLEPGTVLYDFKNIVENNEQLTNEIQKTLNENALSVYEEIRPATEISYGIVFKSIANSIFEKVPVKEIFKD